MPLEVNNSRVVLNDDGTQQFLTGAEVRAAFVAKLKAVLGDLRFGLLVGDADTLTSADFSRHAATVNWSADIRNFVTNPERAGSGRVVHLDGAAEEADTPDNDRLSFGDGATDQPFSIVLLVRAANPGNGTQNLIAKSVSVANQEYEVDLQAGTGYMRCTLYDGGSSNHVSRLSAVSIGTDVTLITMVYDGSGTASGIRLYQGTTRVDTTSDGAGTYVAMENSAAVLSICSRFTTKAQFFEGDFYLAAVTAKELSLDDISTIEELCNGYFGL